MKRSVLWLSLLSVSLLSGCNLFSVIDSPHGDAQLLSAARACFDRGDMECARENYAKLSDDQAEVRASELAFVMLDEAGVGMGAFMTAFGNGKAATGLTKLAGTISPHVGEAKRVEIYQAYLKVLEIKSNPQLRGLVRFASATALAASILAEDAGGDGALTKTDIASGGAACGELSAGTCAASTLCDQASSPITPGGTSVDIVSNPPTANAMNGQPSWQMVMAAMNALDVALIQELGASGSFSSGSDLTAKMQVALNVGGAGANRCLRHALLNLGAGI